MDNDTQLDNPFVMTGNVQVVAHERATVYGGAHGGVIVGDARVYGNTPVYSQVYGTAYVYGDVRVYWR